MIKFKIGRAMDWEEQLIHIIDSVKIIVESISTYAH